MYRYQNSGMPPQMNPQNRGYQGQIPAPYYNRFAPTSNKIIVQSLEDALSRNFDYDSDMACWDINKNLIYNIYTNSRGEKSYEVFEVVLKAPPAQQNEQTAMDAILGKLSDMEQRLGQRVEQRMEELYGKYNAGQNATTARSNAVPADAANTNAVSAVPAE